MMMSSKVMKRLIVFAWLIAPLFVWAQPEKELKFVEENHDFGEIKEADGPAEFKFEFTNTTDVPITIKGVRASCGCTTPDWTKEAVNPGEKGFIKAVYNPRNRPGQFHKTLTVTTSGKQNTIILSIHGKVEPKPRTIEDDFPTEVGALRSKYRAFNMGKVYDNQPVTKDFYVYNQSDNPITFQDKIEAPSYVQVRFDPQVIQPKQKGKVIITYDGHARNDLGFMSDRLTFYTDEAEGSNKKDFTVYADVNEYFAPLTPEEAAVAPKLSINERMHDFGKVEQGNRVSTTFTFTNAGRQPLNIRKIYANCSCTVTSLTTETIDPGEAAQMTVQFNTAGRRGTQNKSVTIYTNDPAAPVQRVMIKASITLPNN